MIKCVRFTKKFAPAAHLKEFRPSGPPALIPYIALGINAKIACEFLIGDSQGNISYCRRDERARRVLSGRVTSGEISTSRYHLYQNAEAELQIGNWSSRSGVRDV